MSALSRFAFPASRRSYSSYFSSKSGGGRYFNSAKPASKAPTPPTNDAAANVPDIQKQDAAVKAAGEHSASVSSSSSIAGSTTTTSSSSTAANSKSKSTSTATATTSPNPAADPHHPSAPASTFTNIFGDLAPHAHSQHSQAHAHAAAAQDVQHPAVSAKDFKLHQFFAMHRPLLLLSHPASILRPVPAGAPLFSTLAHQDQQAQMHRQRNLEALGMDVGTGMGTGMGVGIDAPVDPFVDADAEAARQLTRALTMNKAAAALSWENTLRQLGLDVNKDADRVNLPLQFAREWEEIRADSTKRKRKKKMKKHKLKKRRRATRHERLKLK